VFLDIGFVIGGIGLLYLGAESLVRGASTLALRSGLSPLVVGLTVVAFGTSAPELVVSIQAALAERGGIAVGNVVGSNIANVGLILGAAALIRPLRVDPQLVHADIPIAIGATIFATALMADRLLGRVEGLLLASGLLVYIGFSLRAVRRLPTLPPDALQRVRPTGPLWRDLLAVGMGLGLLVLGAHALVRGASDIAELLGVPATIIGLSVVAVGTSLPELATALVAAARGEGDLALGNVVGSNLFNVLGILGIAAIIRPVDAGGLAIVDLVALNASMLLLLPLALSRRSLSRAEGSALLLLYLGYMSALAMR
jgi:cation:H+ antiporter